MQTATPTESRLKRPRAVLLLALFQGLALYALHLSLERQVWPATDNAWLLAAYAVAVFIPVALQLMAAHLHLRTSWLFGALLALLVGYAGWHHGAHVAPERRGTVDDALLLPFAVMLVWGLHVLPFLQNRLTLGRWRPDYALLFANSWRNAIALAEAALFTGLFWLVLLLWQSLFSMVGIAFFKDLFARPPFIYPVTGLVFGMALHLVGSVDRLVGAVLEQLLNVLKWLVLVAGLLLALFSLALAAKLPALLASGEKAIGAAWLLWLVAIIVLLLNAAWRDGRVAQPYPGWLAQALRYVVPATLLIAGTALYALALRVQQHGLTVPRVWGLVVAGAIAMYAIGYSVAGLRRGPWFAGLGRVNVSVALVMSATVYLTLTPVWSPWRLAANSQYLRAVRFAANASSDAPRRGETPFTYLRFDAGGYGQKRLDELAHVEAGASAAEIRRQAAAALLAENRWNPPPQSAATARALLSRMAIYPAGNTLNAALEERLRVLLQQPEYAALAAAGPDIAVNGLYVDLDGQAPDEFVLLVGNAGIGLHRTPGGWEHFGRLQSTAPAAEAQREALAAARYSAVAPPAWRDLRVGQQHFQVQVQLQALGSDPTAASPRPR